MKKCICGHIVGSSKLGGDGGGKRRGRERERGEGRRVSFSLSLSLSLSTSSQTFSLFRCCVQTYSSEVTVIAGEPLSLFVIRCFCSFTELLARVQDEPEKPETSKG